MTGPTHRQYGICFAYIVSIISYNLGLTQINYYIALILLLIAAKIGSKFPDLDHDWHNIGDKTILNKIINTLIHITGGKHRSWQTHSWDICIWYTIIASFLPSYLFYINKISEVNKEISTLLLLGFASGWISHLTADMLTSEGVRLVCFLRFRVKLVPKKLGPLVFNTGNVWEAFNYKVMKIVNIVLAVICIIYPVIRNSYF